MKNLLIRRKDIINERITKLGEIESLLDNITEKRKELDELDE